MRKRLLSERLSRKLSRERLLDIIRLKDFTIIVRLLFIFLKLLTRLRLRLRLIIIISIIIKSRS